MSKFNFSLSSILHSSARGSSLGASPKTIWRFIIGLTIVVIIVSAAASVFFYKWVSIFEGSMVAVRPEKDAMSTTEIRALVDYYKAKQVHYKELLKTRPNAPILEKGIGVEVDVSAMSTSDDTLNMETEVVVPTRSAPYN